MRQADSGLGLLKRPGVGGRSRGRNLISLATAIAAIATVFCLVMPVLASAAPFETLKVNTGGHGQGYAYSTNLSGIVCGHGSEYSSFTECEAAYATGATVELRASWTGSVNVDWSGCDELTEDNYCLVTMNADREVTATFGTRLLTVNTGGHGQGYAYSTNLSGIVCGHGSEYSSFTECEAAYATGATVELRASWTGSVNVDWSGCDELTEDNYCLVTMNADREVTATFGTRLLTVNTGGHGQGYAYSTNLSGIVCGHGSEYSSFTECEAAYATGATVELRASWTGSVNVDWSGCDELTEDNYCLVTMNADREVTATFGTRLLTVNTGGHGQGYAYSTNLSGIVCGHGSEYSSFTECEAAYATGATVELRASWTGSVNVDWSGCDELTEDNYCLVTMNADREVTATFGTRLLTVNTGGHGQGYAYSTNLSGIVCGHGSEYSSFTECEAAYATGATVELRASWTGSVNVDWSGCDELTEDNYCLVTMNADREVTALFCLEGEALEECTAEGPTNRRTLTVTKEAGGTEGIGTVKSKPKGINCATACDEAVGSFYKEGPVTLTAKPSATSTFVKWVNPGGACDESASLACVMPIAEDESLEALFTGTSKAIASPTALIVSKGESPKNLGFGTVKATGLYCEAECTTTTVLYQGTITEPKPKAAKTVVLSQTPLYGSEFTGWSGCDSEAEGKCTVAMSEAKEVTAEYTAKPNVALTLEKAGTGTGTVTSKPKGVKCAVTCTVQTMSVPSGEAVVLTAKAATGMTFTGWSGGGCSGTGTCTANPTEATTVTATFSGSPKPILSPTALTVSKGEGTGYGTVKAAGIACEALCTSATSLYQGTITEPKPKEAKTVTLEAFSAPGSQTVVWSGCDSETEGKCVVQMSSAKEVTATFDELE